MSIFILGLSFFLLAQADAADTDQSGSTSSLGADYYEFNPVPTLVGAGQSVTLTMAGCVDPFAKGVVPSCPAPTNFADSVSASAGTVKQTKPAEFVYTAPTTPPNSNVVFIKASYSRPSKQKVIGVVIVTDPKMAISASDPLTAGHSGIGKPPQTKPNPKKVVPQQTLEVLGFVNVLATTGRKNEKGWVRNRFLLFGNAVINQEFFSDPEKVWGLTFDRAIGIWDSFWVGSEGHKHQEHAQRYFAGDDVDSFITINFSKGIYAWQAHLEQSGDTPATSNLSKWYDMHGNVFDPKNDTGIGSDYKDLGYNSSCSAVASQDPSKQRIFLIFRERPGHPPWDVDLSQFSGACPPKSDYGEGVFMESYFFLSTKGTQGD